MNKQSNGSGRTVGVIVIIVVVLAGSVSAWYWLMYKPEQEAKEKARLEQIAKDAEQKRKEQAAQKKAKYDKLIEDANAEFEQENWETARSLYSEASSLFSAQQYPKDQLVLVNEKLDEMAALEARIAAGTVETVSSPTGRFYVIVSSSVDDDLAMDYARKLTKEENNVKIIEPTANELFSRVSLGDYDTWDQAVSASASFSTYENVWVLKY